MKKEGISMVVEVKHPLVEHKLSILRDKKQEQKNLENQQEKLQVYYVMKL